MKRLELHLLDIYPIIKTGDTVRISNQSHRVVGNGRVDCEKYLRASFTEKELKDFNFADTKVNEA